MSWHYDFALYPTISRIRLMVADTDSSAQIFQDEEITAAIDIEGSTFQSAQFYSGPGGRTVPNPPVPYRRAAALLLDALAANRARLASIKQLLDVKLDSSDAAIQLRAGAQALRDADDNSGAFFIAEQVNDSFSFRDRWWKQMQRQAA